MVIPSPIQTPADLELLSDAPLTDPAMDLFGFRVFAESLALVIDSRRTETPLTVAISAPWGARKTSVARMVDHLLGEFSAERLGEKPNVVCWFNAWAHGDAPHLGAALGAAVARTANGGTAPCGGGLSLRCRAPCLVRETVGAGAWQSGHLRSSCWASL